MRSIVQTFGLGLLLSLGAVAQSPQPDCQFTYSFSSATAGAPFANKPTATGGTPCVLWQAEYWTGGASGVSVKLEGTNDASGSAGASYTALTAASGSNPMTGTNQGSAILCCDFYPWLRVNPTTFTGTSQTMIFRLYGWRTITNPAASGGVSGSVNVAQWGGATTTLGQKAMASSVPVAIASDQSAIPVTPAANSSVNLAQVAGTNALNGGVAGSQGIGGLAAVGAAPSGNPLPQGVKDSAGNMIVPDYCTSKATVSGAALITGNTQLVAVSGSTAIRVCKVSFTTDTLTTFQLVTGTGATCTSSTAETGVYSGAGGGLFGVLEDYPEGPLITTAAKTLCVALSAGVTTTGGITILYSQR
jgi:hypothetical protein